MKRLWVILSCLALLLPAVALEVRLSADTAAVGELLTLTLTDGGGMPQLVNYPPLALGRWQRNQTRQSTESINRRTSYSSSYTIQLTAPGTLTIPELEVRAGGKTLRTRPQTVKVVPAAALEVAADGGKLALDQALFGRMRVLSNRKIFYLGEEIPLELTLYIAPGVEVAQLSYPELNIPQAVFADYSRVNRENRQFQVPQQGRVELHGRLYQAITFRTAFRRLAPGPLKLTAETQAGLVAPESENRRPSRDPFDDDFFSGFFGRRNRQVVPYPIRLELPETLEIKSPPPVPAGIHYLGLVGDWKINYRFDTAEAKAGDPLSLDLVVSGPGSGETLSAPKLEMPGFRIYPPEIKPLSEGANGAWSIRYVVIPLRSGVHELALKLAVFDPEKGDYQISSLARTFEVQPGNTAAAVVAGTPVPAAETVPLEREPASELNYLKSTPAGPVPLPLGREWRWLWYLLIVLGPLGSGAIVAIRRRLERRHHDPANRRRRAALARKGAVLKAIRETRDLSALVNDEVAALLADCRNLPPGATATEVADALNDEELSPLLRRYGSAAYAPPGQTEADAESRARLCRAIKRLVLSCGIFLAALTAFGTETPFTEAAAAYDRGDFATAAKLYREQLDEAAPDPAVLYNLGCADYRAGDLVAALRSFEEAHLLTPGDRATLENLNVARRKLLLPPAGEVNSPETLLVMLRDQLRPDCWLGLAALVWSLTWLGATALTRYRSWIIVIGAAVILLSAAAAFTQLAGPYNPNRLLVTANPAELRTRPAANSGRVETALPRGTEATLLERRPDWLLIRGAGREGWVRPAEVAPILTQETVNR